MPAAHLDDDLGFLLVRAAALATQRARAALAPVGLRARTFSALALACEPGTLSQREIAARLILDPSQIVPVIDELEALGYVVRTIDPADRRGRRITATDAGKVAFDEARELVANAHAATSAHLSANDHATLVDLLQRLDRG